MKKLLKILLGIIIVIIVLVAVGASIVAIRGIPNYEPQQLNIKVEVTPERVEHGLKLAVNLCIKCHTPLNENQMSGRELTELPAEFGEVYSSNITKDPEHGIGKWTDGELIYFLRTGVKPNGIYAPIWMPKFVHMSDEDLYAVIAFLRSDLQPVSPSKAITIKSKPSLLTKFLCQFAFVPIKYPAAVITMPDTNDLVAYGKYLVAGRYDCFPCHSADFKTVNVIDPEKTPGYMGGGNTLVTLERKNIHSANVTIDETTGIGKWTYEQFSAALRYGQKGNTSLRYPMEPYTRMDDTEVRAIWAYLQKIPKINNSVSRELF